MWHGKELSPADVPRIQVFQLWLALPAKLESVESVSSYIESQDMHQCKPAYVILGNYEDVQSPELAPAGINYLLVTLLAGECWTYRRLVGASEGQARYRCWCVSLRRRNGDLRTG
ncbi:Uncharacterised protein [Serratia liquefaciens]|nr:Uncharacterised protein [Serratia quinivorans]CAI1940702.1 Uncharacterised protein [Serratia liquefaciens]